jgi:hypothetical protein
MHKVIVLTGTGSIGQNSVKRPFARFIKNSKVEQNYCDICTSN